VARSRASRNALRRKARRQVPKLIELYGRVCFYCSCDIHEDQEPGTRHALTVEHLKPISHGGNSNIENLRLACYPCNQKADTATGTPGAISIEAAANGALVFRFQQDDTFAPLPKFKPKSTSVKGELRERTLDLEDEQGRRELRRAR